MKLKSLLLISLLFLSGCSLFQPEVVVQTRLSYIKISCPDHPSPASVRMLTVEPVAIFDSSGVVWVGTTPKHYKNNAINYRELIRYIKGQKGQTKYYRDCILDFNKEIDNLQDLENEVDDG